MKPFRGGLVLVILWAASVTALASPVFSVQPLSAPVLQGASFYLDVNVADVTDLYAFQFDLGFDPTILSAVAVAEGPFLSSGGSTFFLPGIIDNAAGTMPVQRRDHLDRPGNGRER